MAKSEAFDVLSGEIEKLVSIVQRLGQGLEHVLERQSNCEEQLISHTSQLAKLDVALLLAKRESSNAGETGSTTVPWTPVREVMGARADKLESGGSNFEKDADLHDIVRAAEVEPADLDMSSGDHLWGLQKARVALRERAKLTCLANLAVNDDEGEARETPGRSGSVTNVVQGPLQQLWTDLRALRSFGSSEAEPCEPGVTARPPKVTTPGTPSSAVTVQGGSSDGSKAPLFAAMPNLWLSTKL